MNRTINFQFKSIIFIFIMLLGISNVRAYMIKTCSSPEKSYLSEIRTDLLKIKTTNDESNNARIAFIIASAIAVKFNVHVDQNSITQRLNEKTQFHRKISLLDIKQVINELGYSIDPVQASDPFALQKLSREILITQDSEQNFISLVGLSSTNLYFIYGKFNREVIVCPITKSAFLNHYTSNKFLVFK